MQAEIDTDLFFALVDIAIGDPITLQCSTSPANILLKANTDDGRIKAVPEAIHLREIPYVIQGKFKGIQYAEVCTYAILETEGECAVFGAKDGCFGVVGVKARLKLQSVPIGAIKRVIQH